MIAGSIAVAARPAAPMKSMSAGPADIKAAVPTAATAALAAAPSVAGPKGATEAKVSRDDLLALFGPVESGRTVSDTEMNTAVATLQKAQKFFSQYGLDARSGNGQLGVEFDPEYPNAAYAYDPNGTYEALKIGNDERSGKSYANAPDVLAHEYSHRVINNVLGLKATGESGAVNESLADTFAAAMDTDDWTIGEDIVPGGLRSMSDPGRAQDAIETNFGTTPLPSHVKDYLYTDADDGGVHINTGIPNKAAHLIGESLGRQKMADIYMQGILNHMTPTAGIADTARATLFAAHDLYGKTSTESSAVTDAWQAVGIQFGGHKSSTNPNPVSGPAPGRPRGGSPLDPDPLRRFPPNVHPPYPHSHVHA